MHLPPYAPAPMVSQDIVLHEVTAYTVGVGAAYAALEAATHANNAANAAPHPTNDSGAQDVRASDTNSCGTCPSHISSPGRGSAGQGGQVNVDDVVVGGGGGGGGDDLSGSTCGGGGGSAQGLSLPRLRVPTPPTRIHDLMKLGRR